MPEPKQSHSTVALVTGATGAIGEAIARQLAERSAWEVVLVCRNQAKAEGAVSRIRTATGNQHVRHVITDLSNKRSIETLADSWDTPVDVLVNNAAITPRLFQETADGIELQFATNVLGYFWMMSAFAPLLEQSADPRIVNVASYWAGGLDLEDLEFRRRRYDNDQAYRQSKQANRMLTVAFAERFQSKGVCVNACHPGDVNSKLSNDLGFGGHASPDQGARTPVWLATDGTGGQVTGRYFEHMREVACPFTRDRVAIDTLYRVCADY